MDLRRFDANRPNLAPPIHQSTIDELCGCHQPENDQNKELVFPRINLKQET